MRLSALTILTFFLLAACSGAEKKATVKETNHRTHSLSNQNGKSKKPDKINKESSISSEEKMAEQRADLDSDPGEKEKVPEDRIAAHFDVEGFGDISWSEELSAGGRLDPASDPHEALMAGVEAGEAGRWGEALDHFRSVLLASPTWSAAHAETAHALLMIGANPNLIGQHIQQAKLLGRENARLFYLEGLLMEEMKQPAMAAAAYERAVEIRPSMLDARLRLGRLLLQEELLEESIIHLEAAVQLDYSLLPARANLAVAYEAAGRTDDAARQLESIVSLYPENPFHLQRLARFYERHGRNSEARSALRRAEEMAPCSDQRRMRPLLPSRR